MRIEKDEISNGKADAHDPRAFLFVSGNRYRLSMQGRSLPEMAQYLERLIRSDEAQVLELDGGSLLVLGPDALASCAVTIHEAERRF